MCELILSQEERDQIDVENIMLRCKDPDTTLDQAEADLAKMFDITDRKREAAIAAMRRALGLLS